MGVIVGGGLLGDIHVCNERQWACAVVVARAH